MKRIVKFATTLAAMICAACSGGSPQSLATSLETALTHGDMDGALALLADQKVPGFVRFFYMDLVPDCFEHLTCTVAIAPLDDDYKKQQDAQTAKGIEVSPPAEGLVIITESGPQEHGSVKLPFARIDGKYKVISGTFTPAKATEIWDKGGSAALEEAFSKGIALDGGLKLDAAWKAGANKLPEGGGEPGSQLVSDNRARTAAAKANDVDAMIALTGQMGAFLYGDKDYEGHPVSLHRRQLIMRAQEVRKLADVRVVGGYIKDNVAAVLFEGHDGAGWPMRGYEIMRKNGNAWESLQATDSVRSFFFGG